MLESHERAAELVAVQNAVQVRGPDSAFAVAAGGAVFPEHDGDARSLMAGG